MHSYFYPRSGTLTYFIDGKLYQHSRQHKLELTAWPVPVARVKRDDCWHTASRFLADKALFLCLNDRALRLSSYSESTDIQSKPRLLLSGQYVFSSIYDVTYSSLNIYAEHLPIGNEKEFFDTIPAPVLAELARYYDRHWHLLNLLALCPDALDLSRSNPGLFYALANHWLFRPRTRMDPVEEAAKYINQKQKVILEWLGLPAAEPVRRILAKIDPGTLRKIRDPKFWQIIQLPEIMKLLAHLELIDHDVLELVMDAKYHPYLTPRLLAETVRDKTMMDERQCPVSIIFSVIQDISSRSKECPFPKKFGSLQRLMEVYDDLCRRDRLRTRQQQRDYYARRRLGGHFPRPPFAGTETIRPIETPNALSQEGIDMNHCVVAMIDSVAEGRAYVYQVLSPVRATMSMCRQYGQNDWVPGELVAESNRSVDSALYDALYFEVFHSPANGDAEGGFETFAARVEVTALPEADTGRVLARCDLDLEEGQRLPPSWTYRNPMQLPLLAPKERQLVNECLRVFGGGKVSGAHGGGGGFFLGAPSYLSPRGNS
jgi:hypothetical protein